MDKCEFLGIIDIGSHKLSGTEEQCSGVGFFLPTWFNGVSCHIWSQSSYMTGMFALWKYLSHCACSSNSTKFDSHLVGLWGFYFILIHHFDNKNSIRTCWSHGWLVMVSYVSELGHNWFRHQAITRNNDDYDSMAIVKLCEMWTKQQRFTTSIVCKIGDILFRSQNVKATNSKHPLSSHSNRDVWNSKPHGICTASLFINSLALGRFECKF